MKGDQNHDKTTTLPEVSAENEDFVRKRYRKPQNMQSIQSQLSDDNDSKGSHLKFPEIPEAKIPKTTKNKSNLDFKISQLVEFGLTPEVPFRKREIYKIKQSGQTKILLSDFMSKRAQKQILSVHQLSRKDEILEKDGKGEKVKIPSAGSFAGLARKNSLFSRNSQSFQTLPPILTGDLDGFRITKVTENRDQNLKKIEKILDDCKVLLKDSRKDYKRIASQVTMRKSE